MTYLVFDGSFEGLFTAIFELYEYKFTSYELVIAEQFQPSLLLDEVHEVITQPEKAERVIKKVKELMGAQGFHQLLMMYLSEHEKMPYYISYAVVQSIHFQRNYLENLADIAMLNFAKIIKSVSRERHRMLAFIRFEEMADGSFFAPINPDFNVIPLIEKHFRKRYANQKFIIYDTLRWYGIYWDCETMHTFEKDGNFLQTIKEQHSEKEQHFQQLWQQYFKSTTIEERKNTKLHLQHLPKRYWKLLTEKKG